MPDFYEVPVTGEQRACAAALVAHSLEHHPISNVWDGAPRHRRRTPDLRLTGTLGEVVFADAYGLPRPLRSFGAVDGQDFGEDFRLEARGAARRVDVKAMARRGRTLRAHYVLNLSARQVHRADGVTDLFFHVSLSPGREPATAALVGTVSRERLLAGTAGELFTAGTRRVRQDGSSFTFYEDTYEVRLGELDAPPPPAVPARPRRL